MAIRNHIRAFFVLIGSTVIHPRTGQPVQVVSVYRSNRNPSLASCRFWVRNPFGQQSSFWAKGLQSVPVLPC
jgi:hypothetical protein